MYTYTHILPLAPLVAASYTHIYMKTCTYTLLYAYTCTYICMHIYIYICIHIYTCYMYMYLCHPGQRAAALRVPAALPLACVRCHGRGVNTRVFARSRRRSPLLNSTSRRDPSGPYHPPPCLRRHRTLVITPLTRRLWFHGTRYAVRVRARVRVGAKG